MGRAFGCFGPFLCDSARKPRAIGGRERREIQLCTRGTFTTRRYALLLAAVQRPTVIDGVCFPNKVSSVPSREPRVSERKTERDRVSLRLPSARVRYDPVFLWQKKKKTWALHGKYYRREPNVPVGREPMVLVLTDRPGVFGPEAGDRKHGKR